MTLRTQIRDAIDDVAPPAPDLEREVAMLVLAGERQRKAVRSRPRRAHWTYRVQGAGAVMAAALVLVILAGLVFGGRFWRDLNAPPSTVSQTELKNLEGRPLHFAQVAPTAACPGVASPTLNENIGMVIGGGPVYLISSDIYETDDWGYWVSLNFAYDAKTSGLVLIRARDLKARPLVAFANYPLAPTAINAVGPVLGTAQVVGHGVQLRGEAAFPDPWSAKPINKQGNLPELLVLFGMQKGSSGCIGFQVDGPDFSENFAVGPAILEH